MFKEILINSDTDDEPEFMPLLSLDEDGGSEDETFAEIMPVLALKNTVLFPGVVIPINVGRSKSIKAIQKAYHGDRVVAVLSQMDSRVEEPAVADLYQIGTIARVLKLLKMPDGTTTAILQGRKRFELLHMTKESPFMQGRVAPLEYESLNNDREFDALVSSLKDKAIQIAQLSPNIPKEAGMMLNNIANDGFLLSFTASNMGVKTAVKQLILEENNLQKKAELILQHMDGELQMLQLKDQIESKVRGDIDKQQRDFYLNQQLRTIQEELGGNPQEAEIAILVERSKNKNWAKHVQETFDKEIQKVRRINSQMAEYSTMLNYLEFMLDLPWDEGTKDSFDLPKVRKVLEKDHFGLEKVKERIIEHLAVLKLKGDLKAPILCLVGPPGVGKTSLGNSIAKALKRKYVRMSLGGLHDESEIRGHRKTYIGAMPGRVLQSLKKAGANNPVFILDEVDKLGKDFRGDPASALLEVLDPEQNTTFHDNYLDVEYDLSKVLFIATANSLSGIQPALLDRMEIIEVSGYSQEEKEEIAQRHLIPQQREAHGLKATHLKIKPETLAKIVQDYTRESGVRSLNRQVAGVMRRVASKVASREAYETTIKPEDLHGILGPAIFSRDMYETDPVAGVVVGLAWTSVGGDILFIEASLNKGKGKLTLTGNLGDVMKESASTALSFLKAHASDFGLDSTIFEEQDIHIHVPEGAIPKDGPSAGITMLTALASAFTHRPVRNHLAMTGEITLRGKVLPVGGIKEKILAAKRAGIKEIILCADNEKHVTEIPASYIEGLQFQYVHRMSDVLEKALMPIGS